MELDHLVPIALANDAAAQAEAIAALHLPKDFDLAGDMNILAACGPCNSKKSDSLLAPSFVSLIHANAVRLAPEVARLRVKYSRIVSTDRLVLDLVNAVEAGATSRAELDALFWEYFGGSEFNLDFPAHLAGRKVEAALSKADLEDLWDRPVELWGEGRSGLMLVHDDGRELEVHTTRQYAMATHLGFYPLTSAEIKMSSLFDYVLSIFFALENGRPASISFISHPRIGLCDLRYLDKCIAPTFGPDDQPKTNLESARTIQDLVDSGHLVVEGFTSLSLTFRFGGLVTNLREMMRTDIDRDGIEEILVSSYSRADGGTLGFGQALFLGRKSANELVRPIDVVFSTDAPPPSAQLSPTKFPSNLIPAY
jgi:hypothetical protein